MDTTPMQPVNTLQRLSGSSSFSDSTFVGITSFRRTHERGTYFVKTGYRPTPTAHHPSLGAIMTSELPNESIEIPQHISLGNGNWPSEGGFLGDDLDAFKIPDPGKTLQNLVAAVPEERQDRRLKNLAAVTKSFRTGRTRRVDETLHQLTVERSLTIMASDQLRAFEIDKVPQQLRDDYGDTKFGRGCLVARQLVELGVRAVEVMLPGWDCHASNHEGHITQAKLLDPGLSTLIRDLKERDLLDSTVVLCIGEFGLLQRHCDPTGTCRFASRKSVPPPAGNLINARRPVSSTCSS
jgi:hypothetical protein